MEALLSKAARNGKDVSTLRNVARRIRWHYIDHEEAEEAAIRYLKTPDYLDRSKI